MMCSSSLQLIHQRNIYKWLVASISLLENLVGLHELTSESPWPNFSPENAKSLIRNFTDLLARTHFRIRDIKRIIDTGCHQCSEWRIIEKWSHNPAEPVAAPETIFNTVLNFSVVPKILPL